MCEDDVWLILAVKVWSVESSNCISSEYIIENSYRVVKYYKRSVYWKGVQEGKCLIAQKAAQIILNSVDDRNYLMERTKISPIV